MTRSNGTIHKTTHHHALKVDAEARAIFTMTIRSMGSDRTAVRELKWWKVNGGGGPILIKGVNHIGGSLIGTKVIN